MSIARPPVSTLAPSVGYAQVTIASGTRLVSCSGQIALDATGALVGGTDLAAQAQQAVTNLAHALAAAEATFAHVTKLTFYLVNMTDDSISQLMHGAVRASTTIGQPLPYAASTIVGVARLAHPAALIEVEALAVVD